MTPEQRTEILGHLGRAQNRLLTVVTLAKRGDSDDVCTKAHELVVKVEELIEAIGRGG